MNYLEIVEKQKEYREKFIDYKKKLYDIVSYVGQIIKDYYEMPDNEEPSFFIVPPSKSKIEDFLEVEFEQKDLVELGHNGWGRSSYIFKLEEDYFKISIDVKVKDDEEFFKFHFDNETYTLKDSWNTDTKLISNLVNRFFDEIIVKRFENWYANEEGVVDHFSRR